MLLPTSQYTGGGINPLYYTPGDTDNIAIQGGTIIPQGTAMGLVTGTGSPVNEVQTITITGTPTGGTFTLLFGSIIIGPIAFNATAAQVATAINAALGAAGYPATSQPVTTGGGALPGTPVTVTFQGDAAGMSQTLMTALGAFSGGATPAVAVTRSTAGMPTGGYWRAYASGNSDGSQVAKRILKYSVASNVFGNVTFGGLDMAGQLGVANRACPAYFKGYFRCSDLVGLDANAVTNALGKLINGNAVTDANAILVLTGA